MTKEEITEYLRTIPIDINFKNIRVLTSEWIAMSSEEIKIIKGLGRKDIEISDNNFRLRKRYYKTINNNFTFKKQRYD